MTKNRTRITSQRPNKRLTIGLLSDRLDERYQSSVLDGIIEAVEERDVNLLCVAGQALHAPSGFVAQNNVIYDLVGEENVDGLLMMGGSLFHFVDRQEMLDFSSRYSLPVVSIAQEMGDITSVLVDNMHGIREAVAHLITVHGCRRVAFVRGPEGSMEAQARYRAYCEALAAHGLEFDPQLVAPGEFNLASGEEAVRLFFDEYKTDVDAIVAANDSAAFGALQALRARGRRVPGDVAVVGFDDVDLARTSIPPLTTVRQPLAALGRRAVELLLARLAGQDVPNQVMLPTELVVRRSCGCFSQMVMDVAMHKMPRAKTPLADAFPAHRAQILTAVAHAIEPAPDDAVLEQAGTLVDAFAAGMEKTPDDFLLVLDELLRQSTLAEKHTPAWHGALTVLRQQILPLVHNDETLLKAEGLWQQARALVGETTQLALVGRSMQAEQRVLRLSEVSQALAMASNVDELMDIVQQQLTTLGIKSGSIALYEGIKAPSEWSRLLLAYNENGRIALEGDAQRFPSEQLAPRALLPADQRYTMTLQSLYFRQSQLGFALFELSAQGRVIYEALRGQLSSALQNALYATQRGAVEAEREHLLADLEQRTLQLQTASEVSRATSSILNSEELIHRAVDLIRDRFDYYYVGLFLADETGEWSGEAKKWAVLRAGTGAAGREMLAREHKLEIGGNSMIGQCMALGQSRSAQDVGAEAHRFDNPLLSNTHSEMALPLISRGQVIGALSIQSTQEAAFSEADLTVLQMMADQLAIAIQTALLFEQAQLQAERERLVRIIADRIYRATDREMIMRVTLQELGQLLGASKSVMRLGTREQLLDQLVE